MNGDKKWLLYAAGAGAASLAAAPSADAQVIYTNPEPDIVGSSFTLDLNNDSTDDFQFSATKSVKSKTDGVTGLSGAQIAIAPDGYARRLGDFAVIGPGGENTFAGAANLYESVFPIFTAGEWTPGSTGFLGLQIQVASDTYFGWAQLTLNSGADVEDPDFFTLRDYAYESTPGAPITTPQAIPEPASVALLIAGAAGIAAYRRRRAVAV